MGVAIFNRFFFLVKTQNFHGKCRSGGRSSARIFFLHFHKNLTRQHNFDIQTELLLYNFPKLILCSRPYHHHSKLKNPKKVKFVEGTKAKKSTYFKIIFTKAAPKRDMSREKKIKKTLILVFEAIFQPRSDF